MSPWPTAKQVSPPPLSTKVCSMRLPSLLAKVLSCWRKFRFASATLISSDTIIPSLAAMSRLTLSSKPTLKGSIRHGLLKVSTTCSAGARRTGFLLTLALAWAMLTACFTIPSMASFSTRKLEAKPQAPSTITLTPQPKLSPVLMSSSTLFLTRMSSVLWFITRTSAYCAPMAMATSITLLTNCFIRTGTPPCSSLNHSQSLYYHEKFSNKAIRPQKLFCVRGPLSFINIVPRPVTDGHIKGKAQPWKGSCAFLRGSFLCIVARVAGSLSPIYVDHRAHLLLYRLLR